MGHTEYLMMMMMIIIIVNIINIKKDIQMTCLKGKIKEVCCSVSWFLHVRESCKIPLAHSDMVADFTG